MSNELASVATAKVSTVASIFGIFVSSKHCYNQKDSENYNNRNGWYDDYKNRGGREGANAMMVIMDLRLQAMMIIGMVSMWLCRFISGARFHEHKEQGRKMTMWEIERWEW